ncbi:hypothetical protein, partial [Halorussus sp. GCM10023401]
ADELADPKRSAPADRSAGAGAQGQENPALDYFQMIVPENELLEADYANRIVVAGEDLSPGQRPPPVCFAEDAPETWRRQVAAVVDPTATSGLFGPEEEIGGIAQTWMYTEKRVEPGTAYRVSGGRACDGYVRLTVHPLPVGLNDYFSPEVLDRLNRTVANATDGNVTVGNGTDGSITIENAGRPGLGGASAPADPNSDG